jgi:MED7 protein
VGAARYGSTWLIIQLFFIWIPHEHRKRRDELAHNVFLMLQECNKFREHQARELLIELLEQQLASRKTLTAELKVTIARADELLNSDGGKNENQFTNVEPAATKVEEEPSPAKVEEEDTSEPMKEG